ncbi:MAG: glutamate--tRNA ligase, partial [Oscillospiraceae bacterium]|nr:glutamate--tRNA ligase [Oscillospiraceae bacterium]
QGFITEAILNYVTLLGWSPEGEQEIFSLDELIKVFDPARISKSPAIFDIEKLKHFNAEYIRAMSAEQFAAVAEPYIRESVKNPAIDAAAIAELLHQRTTVLTEIPEKVDFFDALPEYDVECFTNKKSKTDAAISLDVLQRILPEFEALTEWNDEAILKVMTDMAEREECKNAKIMWPVRIAVAGKLVTPGGAVEIARILGKEESLRRMRIAIEKLA